jgi:hypothetical protein
LGGASHFCAEINQTPDFCALLQQTSPFNELPVTRILLRRGVRRHLTTQRVQTC